MSWYTEEEDIEENKKAEEPKKKVYASIFMGWSLEDGIRDVCR